MALRLRSAVRISFIGREFEVLARVPVRPTFSLILILLIDNENRMILRGKAASTLLLPLATLQAKILPIIPKGFCRFVWKKTISLTPFVN